MGAPNIGKSTYPPLPESQSQKQPADAGLEQQVVPATAAEADGIYGYQLSDLELEFPGSVPDPPKCVLDNLRRSDRVWRWMSKPFVRHRGMRMYETYSPTAEERKLIANGDAPPGVFVDAENKICWREDAFLASIPRRLHTLRVNTVKMRTMQQTKRARDVGALQEAAGRAGARVTTFNVEEWEQEGE